MMAPEFPLWLMRRTGFALSCPCLGTWLQIGGVGSSSRIPRNNGDKHWKCGDSLGGHGGIWYVVVTVQMVVGRWRCEERWRGPPSDWSGPGMSGGRVPGALNPKSGRGREGRNDVFKEGSLTYYSI
ncbi:hypothetical protein F5Y15DRAFT_196379 [Xylariaceae sp. FL0016]|nr:hypothetical protein F5Y15DRAFT_196379 [Xylariaceae sp. FL0016]